jgi:hypothetical protein
MQERCRVMWIKKDNFTQTKIKNCESLRKIMGVKRKDEVKGKILTK